MQLRPPSTFKMQQGAKKHDGLIRKHHYAQEGELERYYNVYLTDAALGLIGLVDYMETDGDEIVPVEYKTGHPQDGSDSDYHRAQLIAQALLIERQFHRFVRRVKVVYEQRDDPVIYEISGEDKVRILRLLEEMRELIVSEVMPAPTPHEAKCADCEFWRVCLRV